MKRHSRGRAEFLGGGNPTRSSIFRRWLISIFIVLGMGLAGCAAVNETNIGIKDEKVVREMTEGGQLYDEEKYQEALKKFSEAEEQAALPGDKARISEILSRAGFALYKKSLFDESLSYYNASQEIDQGLENKTGLINSYSYIGKIYSDIGKYEEALVNFNQALLLQKNMNYYEGIAHTLNNMANLQSYLGEYRESIGLLNQALEISEAINNPTQTARTLINLAAINFRLRNYQEAVQHLKRAVTISDEAGEESLKAEALNLTGVIYRQQGDYEKALDNYERALEVNKRLGLRREIITSLSIIGELYKERGDYGQAIKYLEESLDMSEGSKDRLMAAVNLNYLGEVYYEQGRYDRALQHYQSSLRVFEEIGFKDRIARSFNNIGYLKGKTKEWNEAIRNFDKAIAIYKNLGDREWIRVSLFGKALSLEEKGDLASAERNYKEAVDIFESIREDISGGREAEKIFTEVNEDVYQRLVALLLRLGKKEEALHYIERSRSKNLRDTFLRNGISSSDERTRGLLDKFDELFRREASINYELVKERIRRSPNPEKIENLTKTLGKTAEELNMISADLKKAHPELYGLLTIEPGSFLDPERRVKLPKDAVFVEYFITDEETYIFLIGENNVNVKSVSIKKAELSELVRLFRDLILSSKSVPTKDWRDDGTREFREVIKPLKEISFRLYDYLIKPIEAELSEVDTIAVIPFDTLQYLPFHALASEREDGTPQFLIEKKKLVYLVSTSSNYLDIVLENGHKKGIESVVAFGNPDLGEPELALPYSEEEVIAIKEMFPQATVYLKEDATKDNFKSSWGTYEIIHLATHAVKKGIPSILLAPLGSGSLTLRDITELPPSEETNLVVLSACDAAIARYQNGSSGGELNSVAMAFGMVGTPSVIATLWRVEDRATFELMEDFYQNIKTEGKFDYEALRKAQVDMLRRPDKYGQPFYWAPFILLGVWE